ncbi:MAG: hypothetical protein DME57_06740 [Verrucomicrobia bacterium]|nr:MAG: hypothetical protein DME57_06740 [Verrucomicrobiota bacterium]
MKTIQSSALFSMRIICFGLSILFATASVTTSYRRIAQAQQSKPQSEPRAARSYSSGDPIKPPKAAAPQAPSPVTFVDITAFSGINFRQAASATSEKYLIETMGGGVAILDYDNDGRMDLFFTNGARLEAPMSKGATPNKHDPRYWNRLYRQKADGTFEDVTERAGMKGEGYAMLSIITTAMAPSAMLLRRPGRPVPAGAQAPHGSTTTATGDLIYLSLVTSIGTSNTGR